MGLISTVLSKVFSTNPRSEAYTKGGEAYYDGSSESSNPYLQDTRNHEEWLAGYYGK